MFCAQRSIGLRTLEGKRGTKGLFGGGIDGKGKGRWTPPKADLRRKLTVLAEEMDQRWKEEGDEEGPSMP